MSQDFRFSRESINFIIGSSNALKISADIEKFLNWLNEYHKDVDKAKILPGYKFFLESIIDMLAVSIVDDSTLEIQEDPIYFRAIHFVDIDLNKVPSTCEKTAILKHLQKELREIRKAKDFSQLSSKTRNLSTNVILPFFLIFNKHCVVNSKMIREKSLKVTTIWMTHIFLSDTERGVPKSVLITPLSTLNEVEFQKSFYGYKIGLQYLWSQLLGKKFKKSSLVKLTEATDWTAERDFSFSFEKIESTPKKKRTDLDTFFSIIQDEIMEPLEKEWKEVRLNSLFRLRGKNPKKYLTPLLSFHESSSLTKIEELKTALLWYDVELLETSTNAIFNGVPAFLTLLAGVVESKAIFANGDQAIVCKFVHPLSSDENDYSYGVLIETGSSIADYSGWILCYDCCGDYPNFTDVGQAMAEKLIERYLKGNKILLREMTIKKSIFKKGILEYVTSQEKKQKLSLRMQLTEQTKESEIKINYARGLILEFLAYYTQIRKGESKIDWNVTERKNEMDVICESDEIYHLIECKVTPETIELIQDFKTISEKLKNLDTNKKRIGQFWFYSRPNQKFHTQFKDFQKLYSTDDLIIEDYVIVKDLLQFDRIWSSKKKDKIKIIFEDQKFNKNAGEHLIPGEIIAGHQYGGSL